jgi:hypothetical protein
VLFFSYRIKKLEFFYFQPFSHGGFLNTSERCSVKYLRGLKLIFGLIFIVNLTRVHASIDSCFHCDC